MQSLPPQPTSLRSIVILSSYLCVGLPSGLFISVSRPKPCMHLFCPPYLPHAPQVSFFLMSSPEKYLVPSRDTKAPCYVVFSTPLWRRPSEAQIFSSVPYSRTHLACVPSSMWETTCRYIINTRVGTLIVATIYLQLIQNRYMFRSFTVLQFSHQHCVQPVAGDVEVVGYL